MVKDKPNSTRLYDEDGYRRRAACVCVRGSDPNQVTRLLFLVISYSSLTSNQSQFFNQFEQCIGYFILILFMHRFESIRHVVLGEMLKLTGCTDSYTKLGYFRVRGGNMSRIFSIKDGKIRQ